jgi:hypothetical protein
VPCSRCWWRQWRDGSGEILGNGVAYAYEWEEVDDERFVKLFLAGLKQASGLSKPGLAVFELVYNELRNTPKQDTVQLSVLTAGLKKTTFYDGLRDLLKREFLFRSPYEGTFFINIRYLFNGDRLAFVKGYARNGAKLIEGKAGRMAALENTAADVWWPGHHGTGSKAMSDDPKRNVLDYLKIRFDRVEARLDRMADDVRNIQVRMSALEADSGYIRVSLAELNGRVDRIETRLDQIERRIDIADAPTA